MNYSNTTVMHAQRQEIDQEKLFMRRNNSYTMSKIGKEKKNCWKEKK